MRLLVVHSARLTMTAARALLGLALAACAACTAPAPTDRGATPTPVAPPTSAACLQDGTFQHQAITYAAGAEPLRFQVYLPSCYEQQPGSRYPVLYLLHGAGGDEYTWTTSGAFEQAANSLIHSGRVPPFIAV